MANDRYWQELFDSLDQMSPGEWQKLLEKCDSMPEVFAIGELKDTKEKRA